MRILKILFLLKMSDSDMYKILDYAISWMENEIPETCDDELLLKVKNILSICDEK